MSVTFYEPWIHVQGIHLHQFREHDEVISDPNGLERSNDLVLVEQLKNGLNAVAEENSIPVSLALPGHELNLR
jgi:hypothetical protein